MLDKEHGVITKKKKKKRKKRNKYTFVLFDAGNSGNPCELQRTNSPREEEFFQKNFLVLSEGIDCEDI